VCIGSEKGKEEYMVLGYLREMEMDGERGLPYSLNIYPYFTT
jgi:hypothetical protein